VPTPHSSLPSEDEDRERRRQAERRSRSTERAPSSETGYGNAYPLRSHSGSYGQRPQSAAAAKNPYTSQLEGQRPQAVSESTISLGRQQPKAPSSGYDPAAGGQHRNVYGQYPTAVGISQRPQSASAASNTQAAAPPSYSRPTVSQANQRPAWHGKKQCPLVFAESRAVAPRLFFVVRCQPTARPRTRVVQLRQPPQEPPLLHSGSPLRSPGLSRR
jgi:hypothetical protein